MKCNIRVEQRRLEMDSIKGIPSAMLLHAVNVLELGLVYQVYGENYCVLFRLPTTCVIM